MELSDILNGSAPDGQPKDPVEKQQESRNDERGVETAPEPVAKESAPEPVERSTSRRKQHQQKERDTREAAEGRVRDENGRYVSKEAAKPETEPAAAAVVAKPDAATPATIEPAPAAPANNQEFTPKERAFLTAAQEERRKRQALEQQLAALQQQAPQEKKTFWDDPEAALQHFEAQTTKAVLQTRLDTSEAIARTRYKDFDENVAEFGQLMQSVPGVKEQWLAAPDPAEFAYQIGKRQKEFKSIGNIEEYRQRVAAEERAKLETEFKAREESRSKLAADLPGSLSDARGNGSTVRPVFTGPTPLDQILGG